MISDQFIEIAETGSAHDMFAELDRMVQAQTGAIIFSCSTFDPITRQAKRVYTNQPEAYPLSGLKDVLPGRWPEVVLDRGQTFVANTISEIEEVFPDHELIARLGCGSVVNMPVILAGSTLGTINLLDKNGHYTEERVEQIKALKPAALIAFAALRG